VSGRTGISSKFDDIFGDLFERDRRKSGKRRGGLLGRLTSLLGEGDRDRSYRLDDRYRDDRYRVDRYRAADRYDRRRDDDDRGYRAPRKRRELFDFDD
jgi:hypothetical protein